MAEQLLYCAGCNASFKTKAYDANRTYPCPKCKQPLRPKGEADTSAGGVAMDTQGRAQTDEGRDPLVGTTVASYKIVRKLGQGGMGSVYEAKHLELGRSVALKILSPRLAAEDPDSVERFKREARAAAVLEHPNVVTTHAVGSEGDHHFIELQLIDGESVQARVQREKGLPVAEATRIILGAAKALGAGHEQNIVHRDIKPANIMLTKKRGSAGAAAGGREWGQVKVMDFGLAKDVTSSAQLTMSGHIMGTPHYMSPEQCDGLPLDGRADIYSLGATYYAILTGQTPYQGTSLLGILRQQADAPIPNVREKRPDVPARVQQVIEKAMAKKPEDRFQTMEELVAALAQVGSAVGGAAPAAATQTVKAPVHTEAETLAATLSDVMDADEERERHLHTARIRSRIKEVEAFVGVWKDLAKAAAVARKAGQASEKDESEFAKLRDSIHKQYASILKRLGNPGSPGQRVISACDTGVTLTSIVQMADADYQDLSHHIQAGARVLYDYKEFLEEGRQDLLKQSTWYFYWDKYVHTKAAAVAVTLIGLAIAGGIGWRATQWWSRRPKPQPKEAAASQSSSSPTTENPQPKTASSSAARSSLPASFTNSTDDSEMIYVPAGTFKMGGNLTDNEKPIHDVSVGSFYIGKYEVTNKQFKKFVDANPQWRKGRVDHSFYLNHWQGDTYPSDTADHPVACVSWFAAKAYCEWADGRLPTEAEWEYACRAGSTTKYCFGDDESKLGDYAWYRSNSDKRTHPIGGKEPNRWGIHGMHGNVWEWCSSIRKDYPYRANDGREDLNETGSHRVVRGGGWGFNLPGCRSAYRCDRMPTDCYFLPALGFRVCVSSRVPKAAGAAEPSALAAQSATSADPLPPGLGRSFMLPDSDKDQHANPVVVRNGSRVDPKTGWPYEIWLKEPRVEFVLIPAGEFMMGSSAEEIQRLNEKYNKSVYTREGRRHRVRITKPFYLAKYETTVAEFGWFVEKTGYRTDADKGGGAHVIADGKLQQKPDASWRNSYFEQGDANPVVCVSWNDASAFCRALSKSKAGQFTLPTEAQWEYACRAGSGGEFCYGDDPKATQVADYAWYDRNSRGKTHPVGGKKANEWRVYDMHGNAREWCLDGSRAYSGSPQSDPCGSQGGSRVLRGGSCLNFAGFLRSACRGSDGPSSSYGNAGFRVVVELRFDAKRKPSAPATETRTPTPETSKAKLPPGFENAFEIPAADKDQHANPVVVRNGSRVDPETGWPYEIWLREPRLEFVLIPAGNFLMGSPQHEEGRDDDEGPVHRVRITMPFYMGKYETTVGQFGSFVRDTGYRTDPEERGGGKVLGPGKKWKQRRDANWRKPYHAQSDAHPVTVVSWNDAVAFCRWLSGSAGVEIRVPTEAQWEHACRAATRTRFHYGDDRGCRKLSDYAWYVDNSRGKLHPVGRKPPSPWGLFDVHGSAGEWCLDVFDRTYYSRSSSADPEGPSKGNGRVVRGGCWLDEAKYARSANRSGVESSHLAYASVGFRCVAVLPCSQEGLTHSVPDNFAYGYFFVSPEAYQDFQRHVARVAPYTNVAVTHKQHLSVAMPVLARFGIKALIRGFKPHSRDPKKAAESFRKELLPVWRKHREHILAVYLIDEPYGVQGGKANMTPTELRDLVKQCNKACPKLPVFVNFLVSPDSNFWRQQDPLPEEVDIVGFDHYVRGTADEVRSHTLYSVSSLRRLSRGKPVFICGRSLTGRGKKQAEPSYGPLDPAEADAYKDAAVQAGASGLIWAFYDAEAWSGLHGACFSPSIFPVHERIAKSLGVRKLR